MRRVQSITYDKIGDILYIALADAPSNSQRNVTEDVILDFADDGSLVGIELLDPNADLRGVIQEYSLDPHILDVLAKIRDLIPEARERLVLA